MKNPLLNKAIARTHIIHAVEASIIGALDELGLTANEAHEAIEHLIKHETYQGSAVSALCAYKRKLFLTGGTPKPAAYRLDEDICWDVVSKSGHMTNTELGDIIAEQARIDAGA